MALTEQQANALIATKLEEVSELLNECQELAKQFGLTFQFDHDEAINGYYEGKPGIDEEEAEYYEDWQAEDLSQPGWRNSSSYCS
jgi:hypothetical protein